MVLQALEQARERASSLEAQVHRTNELATSLAAHQQVKAAQLQELEENRRSIALLDQALGVSNRDGGAQRMCIPSLPCAVMQMYSSGSGFTCLRYSQRCRVA